MHWIPFKGSTDDFTEVLGEWKRGQMREREKEKEIKGERRRGKEEGSDCNCKAVVMAIAMAMVGWLAGVVVDSGGKYNQHWIWR